MGYRPGNEVVDRVGLHGDESIGLGMRLNM